MKRTGEGDRKCQWYRDGRRCGNWEVDGLEYCVQHVPDDLLDEAEEVTGIRRCRQRFGQPDACRRISAAGTVPPACENHGANAGSVTKREGVAREYEGKMAERLAGIMADSGEKLLAPRAIEDPLTELLDTAAEIRELKEVLRVIAAQLFSQQRIRYAHAKVGEQLRVEILLYERAVERYAKLLIDIARLRIDERLAGVQEQTAQMLERAVEAALE